MATKKTTKKKVVGGRVQRQTSPVNSFAVIECLGFSDDLNVELLRFLATPYVKAAQHLGLKPVTKKKPQGIYLSIDNLNQYDFEDVLEKILERMIPNE